MPDAGGYRPAIIWRSLAVRAGLAALPAFLTLAVLAFSTPWRLKLLVGSIAALSVASPLSGFVAVALLAPLGHFIGILTDLETFRISEALVLAFFAGWLLRPGDDRPGPRVPSYIGWLFALAVVLSVLSQAWQLGRYRGELAETFQLLFHAYYFIADRIGFIAGARILEGIALAAATVMLLRRYPRLAALLPAALVTSGVVAAASSVLLWRGIAPAPVLERYLRIGYRVSAHIGDANAAGSYFAMILCLAIGVAWRAGGIRRVAWLGSAAAVAVGLWFSQSRSAFAAAGIVLSLAAAWWLLARQSLAVRAAALATLLAAGIGVGAVRARQLETDPTYRGAGFRQQFNAASSRMIAARPASGVGVGQYYRMSALFLSPQLAFTYGHENAHNNFLQVAGELGVIGFALFLAWMAAGFAAAARALAWFPRDARLLGAAAGAAALVGTCLTGHPLLVDEVAFPFWMQFGLMVALAGSALRDTLPTETQAKADPAEPRLRSLAAATLGVLTLVTAPLGAWLGGVEPPASAAVDGFYRWETAADGTRYRWSEQYASLFVPADVTRVYVPVRMPARIPAIGPIGVEVRTEGIDRGRSIIGDSWADLNIVLPDVIPPTRFKRIDLRVDRTWQPGVYLAGSGDMRQLGIQVGEVRLFHEY